MPQIIAEKQVKARKDHRCNMNKHTAPPPHPRSRQSRLHPVRDSGCVYVDTMRSVEITKKGLPILMDRLEEMTAAEIVQKGLPKLIDRLGEVQNG